MPISRRSQVSRRSQFRKEAHRRLWYRTSGQIVCQQHLKQTSLRNAGNLQWIRDQKRSMGAQKYGYRADGHVPPSSTSNKTGSLNLLQKSAMGCQSILLLRVQLIKQPKCAQSIASSRNLHSRRMTQNPGSHYPESLDKQIHSRSRMDNGMKPMSTSENVIYAIQNGFPPTGLTCFNFHSGTNHSSGGYKNPEDARVYFDNFTIFSNRGKDPAFDWSAHPDDKGYAVAFDQSPTTIPSEKITHTTPFAQFKNTQPGSWFFHVRTQDKNGKWSETTHRNIVIEP